MTEKTARARRAPALPRFRTPAALPIHRGPPLPGFACPGHVASSHLPCASSLFSLSELPGVFSTRRALGAPTLQSLTGRRSPRSLDVASPLAISEPAAQSRNKASAYSPPRDWPSAGSGSSAQPICVAGPSRIYGDCRAWRLRHCCTLRLRFRGFIPPPVGATAKWISPLLGALAFLGFASLGRSPSLPSSAQVT